MLVQSGPQAYSASNTMNTGSFPGVKRPGRSVNYPSPSNTEIKERVELYLYFYFVPPGHIICCPLPLPLIK